LYIAIGKGDHLLSRKLARLLQWIGKAIEVSAGPVQPDGYQPGIADTYHGKVVPLGAARQLVSVKEDIRLENLEQIIPYTKARDIILKNPDHIVVLDCPCRVAKENPCLPVDVCLIVGEPFASYMMEHTPEKARWISQAEAEAILQAEDERGHVHHAFFKDASLGRFYAICNCCACCCGAMKAHQNGIPMLASSGYICEIDENLCAGCGICLDSCQFGALRVDGTAQVEMKMCMGCGVCVNNCPQGAMSLRREAARGEPLEIAELIANVMTESALKQ
jgi:ferredoxin